MTCSTACLTLVLATLVLQAIGAPSADAGSIREEMFQLDNGLLAVVRQVPGAPTYRVNSYFAAGSSFEPDSLAGLAHLAEHLLTESTRDHPEGGYAALVALHTLHRNASTNHRLMWFTSTCLPQLLEEVLALEAERMSGCVVDSTSFVREQQVVLEELALRTRLSPHAALAETAVQLAYEGHPFARDVAGTRETVSRIAADHVEAYLDERIAVNNAVLVVSGPGDPDSVTIRVRAVFGDVPAPTPAAVAVPDYPELAARQTILDASDHDGVRVAFACRLPITSREDGVIATLLAAWLDHVGAAVRLYPQPREWVLTMTGYRSYYRPPTRAQEHWETLHGNFDPERDAQNLLSGMWRHVGAAADSLLRGRGYVSSKRKLNDILERESRSRYHLDLIGSSLSGGGAPPTPSEIMAGLDTLSASDLHAFMRAHVNPGRTCVAVSHGRDSQRQATHRLAGAANVRAMGRIHDPMALLDLAAVAPVLEAYRTGVPVQLALTHIGDTPMVVHAVPDAPTFHLEGLRVFPPPKECRPDKLPGQCELYNRVVDWDPASKERAGTLLPHDCQFTLLPWELRFRARSDAASARAACTTVAGRLSDDRFKTYRWSRALEFGAPILAERGSRAENQAMAWHLQHWLGKKTAAAGHYAPSADTPRKIKYKDLQKLHRKAARDRHPTVLWMSGGLTVATASNLGRGCFPMLGSARLEVIELDDSRPPGVVGRVFTSAQKADARLTLTFGPALARQTDSSQRGVTSLVVDAVLTRIMMSRLRKQEGLTYSAGMSHFTMGGVIIPRLGLSCQPRLVGRALAAVSDELGRLAASGPTADEIARGRLALVKEIVVSLDEPGPMPSWLRDLVRCGAAPPADPVAAVLDLEEEAIRAATADYVSAADFAFSVVGPVLEDDLELYLEALD
ncbi:MAG: insulinase family protein [bacterium]|nr:insulinase family protein [bacterium]